MYIIFGFEVRFLKQMFDNCLILFCLVLEKALVSYKISFYLLDKFIKFNEIDVSENFTHLIAKFTSIDRKLLVNRCKITKSGIETLSVELGDNTCNEWFIMILETA